ncbi:hypothetical protein HYQ45_016966 [Verticillium longisporum]|uniref:Alpha/beta hydrolase fold-3 domain-containing protein n=1 Tax=Verticillium longisporum TaxID=100787 RepID=A0A8I2Z525_VERLO|nr:hypothetical protein HYQ45_016966 [Verticillium longisporum]
MSSTLKTGKKPGSEADAHQLRAWFEGFIGNVMRTLAYPGHIHETKIPIQAPDGTAMTLHRFATRDMADSPTAQPAVLHVHGGGMISSSYRLAPGHPGDGPVADVYAALGFLSAYAAEWNVDPAWLAITGDSAGGGLAAGAALLVRNGNPTPPLAKQLLIYPRLDDRTGFRGGGALERYHFWTAAYNRTAWEAVLGAGRAGAADAGVPIRVAPG